MCSIFGAVGPRLTEDDPILQRLREAAGDRGRDGGRMQFYDVAAPAHRAALGNWRATPTPEVEVAPFQPYDGVVHNGTIANDRLLGALAGEVDSMVLPRVLDRSSLEAFASSVLQLVGSYALAVVAPVRGTVFAAVNYKPLHYWMSADGTVYFSSMARHFRGCLPYGTAPRRLPPYTAIDLFSGEALPLLGPAPKKVVVIASAGLDSTVAATTYARQGWEVRLLHFRYGCRAETREAQLIPQIAEALGASYAFLDVDYTRLAGGSPLLDASAPISGGVSGSEYAHEWVPARNLVLISLAAAYAEANGFHVIALGNNLEEAGAYPDNEEQFTLILDEALPFAVQNGYRLRLESPVGNLMKHEIVALGRRLEAPLHLTWSCYRGGERHCGECGPCRMRRTAFERGGAVDPVFASAVHCAP